MVLAIGLLAGTLGGIVGILFVLMLMAGLTMLGYRAFLSAAALRISLLRDFYTRRYGYQFLSCRQWRKTAAPESQIRS